MKHSTLTHLPDSFGRPLRDLRISVTDRCNFRCPYCMPAEIFGENYSFLPRPEILTFEETVRLARLFATLGVRKIRITGGEPLLRASLPSLIAALAGIGGIEDMTLTTNGYLLAAKAAALKESGLDRVTVSLDSLDSDIFQLMSGGRFDPQMVLDAIDVAAAVGLSPIKINCVVQRGLNDDGIVDLARQFRGSGHVIRFIEFMDVGTLNDWDMKHVVGADEILERINERFPLEELPPNCPGEVAKRYRYLDGSGEIGVISSVSKPFCGYCTRARLSTEGSLVNCLFASSGTDLKTPMLAGAGDEELLAIIKAAWSRRSDRYSEERFDRRELLDDEAAGQRIQMYQIGG